MGVKGLWTLLAACGHQVDLDVLQGKVVAIDANIWLMKILTVSSEEAGPFRILFQRICKLVFYGIKPVFVFDGVASALKHRTLKKRRLAKENSKKKLGDAARKLLFSRLKAQLLKEQVEQLESLENQASLPSPTSPPSSNTSSLSKRKRFPENQTNNRRKEQTSHLLFAGEGGEKLGN